MIWLLACQPDKSPESVTFPEVYPRENQVVDGQLALNPDDFASVDTPFPVERVAWRTGFSPVQTALTLIPGVDAFSLSGQDGVGVGGSVRLFDLDTREEIPAFAELDAWPEAGDRAALLVRPQARMTPGHRIGVVLTSRVTVAGSPLTMAGWAEAEPELAADLGALDPDTVFGWVFPVGEGTLPVVSLAPEVPTAWSLTEINSDISPGILPEGVWKKLEGTISVDNYLVDDTHFDLVDGIPQPQGKVDAEVHIYFPDAIRAAASGSVPVLLFGHGILSHPDRYFDEDDPSNVIALANRLGAVMVATTWRGLTMQDNLHAIEAAGDFARIYEVTEMLGQGIASNLALMRAMFEGDLLADPLIGGIVDPSQRYYYGISLGSIEGAVLLGNQERVGSPFAGAVLHVGGSTWSTMLERSSNWTPFESIVARTVEDPFDRQKLYAASQLFWDPVDPALYVEALIGQRLLFQESIGDEQVPNITTEALIRSLGLPVAEPLVGLPYGMEAVGLPYSGAAMVQFDPELPMPDPVNRPAAVTGAHGDPRMWWGALEQTATFLETGEIVHFCGAAPCSATNQGSP